jgi:hypothetical protein
MSGAIHPLPQYVSIAWCLVKHRDNFTFTLAEFLHIDFYILTYYYFENRKSPDAAGRVRAIETFEEYFWARVMMMMMMMMILL